MRLRLLVGLALLFGACVRPEAVTPPVDGGLRSVVFDGGGFTGEVNAILDPVPPSTVALAWEWRIQSVDAVGDDGAALSQSLDTSWIPARVPSTVVGSLVDVGALPDPSNGMTLRDLPGMGYAVGEDFTDLEMPDDSPFKRGWWYRTPLLVPDLTPGQHVWLHLDGVNTRATVWVNGAQIGGELVGTFRAFDLDIASAVRAASINVIAIKVLPPTPDDLATTWIDWNPSPPDKNMGLWREVTLHTTGAVALRHPFVATRLANQNTAARLTVEVEAVNATLAPVSTVISGRFGDVVVTQVVALAAGETRTVTFAPQDFPQLEIANPQLWWPAQYGEPALQHLEVEARVADVVSDQVGLDFGLREVTSEVSAEGARVFSINGQPIFIRGAGWARDLLFRETPERERNEVAMVRSLNLNTVRFEGPLASNTLLAELDRQGVLVMPGWACCDLWQESGSWSAAQFETARESMRTVALRLREHPSVITWLYGSDEPPTPEAEAMYLDVLAQTHWPNPTQSSVTDAVTPQGPTGFKMRGPYDWVTPTYWLGDETAGGAFGFATEISPGPSIPELEGVVAMLGLEVQPGDDAWNYHCAAFNFTDTSSLDAALTAHFGAWADLAEYVREAQVLNYEAERAMFEGWTERMHTAGGLIQWMLNNAWPSLYWHLYDSRLAAAGAFYGAKKGLEPVHVQYSPTDEQIVVVNSTLVPRARLVAHTRWVALDGSPLFEDSQAVSVDALGVVTVLTLPAVVARPQLSFLQLDLTDESGALLSTNFYWLPAIRDVVDWSEGDPLSDYSALGQLAPAQVSMEVEAVTQEGNRASRTVTVTNTSSAVAFFLRLALVDAQGAEVLPSFWSDNDLSLLPGASRTVSVSWTGSAPTSVTLRGWNTTP